MSLFPPSSDQRADLRARWAERPVIVTAVNPRTAQSIKLGRRAGTLASAGAGQIFLGCIGYTTQLSARLLTVQSVVGLTAHG